MYCKNCGALVREGEELCPVCATPVNMNTNSVIEDVANPATTDFMQTNPMVQKQVQFQPQGQPLGDFMSSPMEINNSNRNKDAIPNDGNDRVKATLFNFVTFAIIIGIAAIALYFVFNHFFG